MEWRNCLKKVISEQLGIDRFSPSDELLKQLAMDRRRFFSVLNNIYKMTAYEAIKLAEWLDVHPKELIEEVSEVNPEEVYNEADHLS
jgi:hypothetical protein